MDYCPWGLKESDMTEGLTHIHTHKSSLNRGLPGGSVAKNLLANVGDAGNGFDPWVGKIPWGRKWQLTLVFLPGESQGQRSHGVAKSWT